MINNWIKRIGKLLGFKKNTICYNFKYIIENNFD